MSDVLPTLKVSWKPVRSRPLFTCTLCNASTTGNGAGSGTASGPISNVRWILSSTRYSWYALRQRNAQPAANFLGQFLRAHRAVGIAHAPELLWIAQVTR